MFPAISCGNSAHYIQRRRNRTYKRISHDPKRSKLKISPEFWLVSNTHEPCLRFTYTLRCALHLIIYNTHIACPLQLNSRRRRRQPCTHGIPAQQNSLAFCATCAVSRIGFVLVVLFRRSSVRVRRGCSRAIRVKR